MTTIITIVNRSSVPDAEIHNIVPALQAQVNEDFLPHWQTILATVTFPILNFVGAAEEVPADTWPLYIRDHTDVAGAGGYHMDQQGRVSGEAFWLDAVAAGEAPSVDVSHELLEMLADPTTDCRIGLLLGGRWAGYECLREVCDPVEADALGYTRAGADGELVRLSDFVLPAYFFYGPSAGGIVDFKGHLGAAAPALLEGGYLAIYDPVTRQWTQHASFDKRGRRSRRALRHGRSGFAARR